jgi:hypothetical protein
MTVDKIIEDKAMKTWESVFIGVFLQIKFILWRSSGFGMLPLILVLISL